MALDWTLLLLVVSALVTNIHRLMQCTRDPATHDAIADAINNAHAMKSRLMTHPLRWRVTLQPKKLRQKV